MSDTAYNPNYLSAMSTDRHSLDGIKGGSEMTRFAEKIIKYEGDDEGLEKLRAEFKHRFSHKDEINSVGIDVKADDWRKNKSDRFDIDDSLPPVETDNMKLYSVFANVMCGRPLQKTCKKYHLGYEYFHSLVSMKKLYVYAEVKSGVQVVADNYKDLVSKVKEKHLDAPQTVAEMSYVFNSRAGDYTRKSKKRKHPSYQLIGTLDKTTYVQEVVYKGADDEQGE